MNVSVVSTRTNNLQLSPYKIKKRQCIIPAQKHKKLEKVKIHIRELKAGTADREIIFFSDEKLFTAGATVNNQIDKLFKQNLQQTLITP